MRLWAISIVAAVLALAGCGGSSQSSTGTGATTTTTATSAGGGAVTGKLPRGTTSSAATNTAAGSINTAEQGAQGPAATEASPEAAATAPAASGQLSASDRTAVTAVVSEYIAAIDRHRAGRVCTVLVPGALRLSELPRPRADCRASLRASIGTRPRGGGPAWSRTSLVDTKVERLSDDRARVSATVTHHFSDRKYVSVEDDVIYLQRAGSGWLIAKPSATLYRAVGYAQPPLRAFSPPSGWG